MVPILTFEFSLFYLSLTGSEFLEGVGVSVWELDRLWGIVCTCERDSDSAAWGVGEGWVPSNSCINDVGSTSIAFALSMSDSADMICILAESLDVMCVISLRSTKADTSATVPSTLAAATFCACFASGSIKV